MHAVTEEILSQYQVRKTMRQKAAFRAFLREKLGQAGMQVIEETSPILRSVNLVVGDVSTARYVFTAHYDTCAQLPIPNFIAPKNLLITLLYQVLLALFFLLIVTALGVVAALISDELWFVRLAVGVASLLCLYCLLMGKANPHTANDNTSGVAVLVEALLTIPAAAREKAAFVFFDNEETGLLGSFYFKKIHKKAMRDTPLINFDCVSDGDTLLFVLSKKMRGEAETVRELSAAMLMPEGKAVELCSSSRVMYPSDQMHFQKSVGVVALKRMPIVGLYLNRIHTKRDTVFDARNIEALRRFILALF